MLTREDVMEKLKNGELTPQRYCCERMDVFCNAAYQQDKATDGRLYQSQRI